jgi:uncharacterized protein (DUF427 family)
MKATLSGHVVAESDDIVESGGYAYFPSADVRLDWLQQAPRTGSVKACAHGVQFCDVLVDGVRLGRAAWVYEAPRGEMRELAGRFGFWGDVDVG